MKTKKLNKQTARYMKECYSHYCNSIYAYETFPLLQGERVCFTFRRFLNQWSFPLFSWPQHFVQGEYCEEKIGSQSLLWVKGLILKRVFNMLVCLSSFLFKCWKSNVNVFCSFSRTITRDDLVEYISKHYSAPRMVLAAAGGKFFLPYSIFFSLIQSGEVNL